MDLLDTPMPIFAAIVRHLAGDVDDGWTEVPLEDVVVKRER